MPPQRSDAHPPDLQQLAQPHPHPLPPAILLFLPLATRVAGATDATAAGWSGRVRILSGRGLLLFLLLIGCQQYLDRARLFTGGQQTARASEGRSHAGINTHTHTGMQPCASMAWRVRTGRHAELASTHRLKSDTSLIRSESLTDAAPSLG